MYIKRSLKILNLWIDYPGALESFAQAPRAVEKAKTIVPYLYYYLLYQALSVFAMWQTHPDLSVEQFKPIWPVFWLSYMRYDHAVLLVTGLFLLGMFAAAVFFEHRVARVAAFVSMFVYHAFVSSFGNPNHNWIVWIYPLFFLIFLPDIWYRESTLLERKKFLIGFFGAQSYIGVIYSMAGFGKVVRGIAQLFAGQANFLSPDAFALHIANWLPTVGDSVLGPTIVAHPLLGWPLFLGMLYFQFFTVWAIFKPRLQRVWGIFLISFYILNFLTMNILYADAFFLIAALLLNSPFERPETTWRDRALDLPIFGPLFARIMS